jgi:hypothetical protein
MQEAITPLQQTGLPKGPGSQEAVTPLQQAGATKPAISQQQPTREQGSDTTSQKGFGAGDVPAAVGTAMQQNTAVNVLQASVLQQQQRQQQQGVQQQQTKQSLTADMPGASGNNRQSGLGTQQHAPILPRVVVATKFIYNQPLLSPALEQEAMRSGEV